MNDTGMLCDGSYQDTRDIGRAELLSSEYWKGCFEWLILKYSAGEGWSFPNGDVTLIHTSHPNSIVIQHN